MPCARPAALVLPQVGAMSQAQVPSALRHEWTRDRGRALQAAQCLQLLDGVGRARRLNVTGIF